MSEDLQRRLAAVEREVAILRVAADRGAVENVFNRYMHYHNAYEDQRIIDELWAKPGTPGIRARYNNVGVYTTYESVTAYHRGRPKPVGKLLLPLHDHAGHRGRRRTGETAKGIWIMAGTRVRADGPRGRQERPEWVFSGGEVDGKPVWAHWVWCKYGVDFLKQDGEWRIWHFRCYEVARAPFNRDWVSFAKDNQESHDSQLAWFGDDGVPVFLPPVDEPVDDRLPPVRQRPRPDPRPGSAAAVRGVRGHVPVMARRARPPRRAGPVWRSPARHSSSASWTPPSSTSRFRRCRRASGCRRPVCSGW